MAPLDGQEETEGRRSTIKPPPLAEPVEKPKFNLWQTVKKSAGEIWDTVGEIWDTAKNHPGKTIIAALTTAVIIVATGGVAAGVMAGIAGGLVAAKVTKDIAVNYGEANPESKVGRLVGAVKAVGAITKGIGAKINTVLEPFKKVAKSISHSLGNTWETIKNNKFKAAALVGGALVFSGIGIIAIAAIAAAGFAAKAGYDVYKDQKAGWPDHQASPKNIQPHLMNPTQSQALSKQHQQEISSLKAQLTEQAATQIRMQAQMAKMAAMQGTTRVSEYSSVTSSTTPANQASPQHRTKSFSK